MELISDLEQFNSTLIAKKKKILLLSDDLRMSSGIKSVSKEFVMGTFDKFDWVQLGVVSKSS